MNRTGSRGLFLCRQKQNFRGHSADQPFSRPSRVFAYNRPQCCTGDCAMRRQEPQRVGKQRWRGALAVVAICVLTVSFATRFGSPGASFRASIHSHSRADKSVARRSLEPERQHLDRDGAEWAPPNAANSLFHLATAEPAPISTAALLPTLMFAGRLYIRPPPYAQLIF